MSPDIIGNGQTFSGHKMVRGGHHVESPDPTCIGVRWRCSGLAVVGWPTEPQTFDRGEIQGFGHDGFQLSFSQPVSLRVAADLIPSAIACLLTLASGVRTTYSQLEIQLADSGGWLTYCAGRTSPPRPQPSELLPASEMTLPRLAKWLDLQQLLGPLPFTVTANDSTLQRDAHTQAASLEGVHRRLHDESAGARLPGSTEGARKRARKAAVKAATASLAGHVQDISEEDIADRYRGLLAHAGDATYKERLRDIVDTVYPIAPELFRPDPSKWIEAVVKLRNNESHKLTAVNDFGEEEISEYHALTITMRWTLWFRLLLAVEVDADALRRARVHSERYLFTLANLNQEWPWPDLRESDQRESVRALLARLCEFWARIDLDDNRFEITIPGLPISAEGATRDEALDKAVPALRDYTTARALTPDDAPAQNKEWGLVQLIDLSTDDELRSWIARH